MNYILLKDLPDAKAGETLEQYDEDTYKIGKHYWTSDIVTSMTDWFAPMHSYSEIRIKALEDQLAKISADYAKLEAQNMELATGSIKLMQKCEELEEKQKRMVMLSPEEYHKLSLKKWTDGDMKNIAMQYLACNKHFGSVDLFFDAWVSTRL